MFFILNVNKRLIIDLKNNQKFKKDNQCFITHGFIIIFFLFLLLVSLFNNIAIKVDYHIRC